MGKKLSTNFLFRFKKRIQSTDCELSLFRNKVICCPASVKSLSEGTDEEGIAKYFLAKIASIGNFFSLSHHHFNGSFSSTGSTWGMFLYDSNSSLSNSAISLVDTEICILICILCMNLFVRLWHLIFKTRLLN